MNKKIKGYELMKLIGEKKIKKWQKFLFTNADGVEEKIFWDGENLKYIESERDYVRCIVGDIEFAVGDFELLEDKEEIDIKKLDITVEAIYDLDSKTIATENRFAINKIIDQLCKLDKKINKED